MRISILALMMVRLEELNAAKKEVEKVAGEKLVDRKMFEVI